MRFKLGIILVFSFFRTLLAVEPFEVAEKKAIKENKPLMIFFMGSGWCHWCEEMKKKILSKRDFLRNVENDFIILEVDFPRGIGKKKNEMTYKKRFGVGRYPTVVIYDPRTDRLFRESGFRDISPKEYAIRLKEKFFENNFEGLHIGKGGLWGMNMNKDLDISSKEQISKSTRYVKGRKADLLMERQGVDKTNYDEIASAPTKPIYEWIHKSFEKDPLNESQETSVRSVRRVPETNEKEGTELAKEVKFRSLRKEPEIRWEKYPKGALSKSKSFTKKIKKVEAKIIRIGFGGTWWVFKSR